MMANRPYGIGLAFSIQLPVVTLSIRWRHAWRDPGQNMVRLRLDRSASAGVRRMRDAQYGSEIIRRNFDHHGHLMYIIGQVVVGGDHHSMTDVTLRNKKPCPGPCAIQPARGSDLE